MLQVYSNKKNPLLLFTKGFKSLRKVILIFTIFLIPSLIHAQSNIARIEYYIDTDPGFGHATNVNIAPSSNVQNVTISLDPTPLTEGVHRFFARAKDADGNWSLTNTLLFYKPYGNGSIPPAPAVGKMNRMEYYIDNDPGYGNGVPVALDSLENFADYVVPINVTGLSTGDHTFWVRGLDKNGNWSMMNSWEFTVTATIATPSIVVNSITHAINCAQDSFDISYDATGTYNSGNVFNVELSDATGSFGSTSIIGSYSGTGNSIIQVKLPSHLQDGENYKIRVSSTNPVVTGISSNSITIHDRPHTQAITGAGYANATFTYPYSVTSVSGSTWKWFASAATITQTTSNASLVWNTQGQPQTLLNVETNQYGCVGDTSIKTVNVYDLKIDNVASSTITPCPLGTITVTGNATGVYDAANKFTAQLSDASGSFANAVNIGTVTGNPVGLSQSITISATLPFPLANGTGYRVRIIANSPSVTGADNGQNIVINKPDLGADQIVSKCPGFVTDISSVFNSTGFTDEWSTTSPSSVDIGTYSLIVTNANGCKDTANVTVNNYPKPDLGADKSTTISCANGSADLSSVYNLTGLTAVYNTPAPATAPVGIYTIIAKNTNSCADTATITVLDASIATVPASGSNTKTATRECTDAAGWTHYYNDNGTPTDYSDDIRLLSIKKNGNNIGTIGDGRFEVKVAATTGAGSNHGIQISSNLVPDQKVLVSMNRYWNITPTHQPASSVGVRFYYNTQDLNDVNGDAGSMVNNSQLNLFKVDGGNSDPTTNWDGDTAVSYYLNGATPSLSNWEYTDLGNNISQAEFLVNSFSGGGAGVIIEKALPVTITSFTATAQKDKVLLLWQTATEINSKEFAIQRSLDGIHFQTIGSVPAAGNSNISLSYHYDDLQSIILKGQVVFFRIMETDLDGKVFYTTVKKVKVADDKNKLSLKYNPVREEAVLKYECINNEKVQVRLIDHLGRVILATEQQVMTGINEIKLKTGNLAKGIYEVQLSSNHDQYYVRMMKE